MSTTATAPSASAIADWIRPWYPAGVDVHTGQIFGHLFPDCEELLRVEVEPREGSGWLDPRAGAVCEDCLERHDPKLATEILREYSA
ncbi:hypothetical protein OG589_14720 [Sphaerisporangium sp. NBC_01403]|uniref:hypothetical protein n=1 Tax=Sphaerisporangium sp. NBC_01403 TaxID=2903599 RepID=UPI003255F719